MNKFKPKPKPKPIKDKTITCVATDLIEGFRHIADDFMLDVFDYLPG